MEFEKRKNFENLTCFTQKQISNTKTEIIQRKRKLGCNKMTGDDKPPIIGIRPPESIRYRYSFPPLSSRTAGKSKSDFPSRDWEDKQR